MDKAEFQSQFNRLPPHSIEAERAAIGSILRINPKDPSDVARLAKMRQMISADSFYLADHQIIFVELIALLDSGNPGGDALAIALTEVLSAKKILEEVGGYAHVAEIIYSAPHPLGLETYAGVIREKAMLRGIISLSNETLRKAYGPTDGDGAESLAIGLSKKAAMLAVAGKAVEVHRIDAIAQEVFESLEAGSTQRIPTGLANLDHLIGGLRIGGKMIIGAKPGMGKSLLLKQVGFNLARRGVKFGVISVEESRGKIGENILSNASGVNNNRIAFRTLTTTDWNDLAGGLAVLDGLPFYVIDTARKISSIVAAARLLNAEFGCQVIACDHLHIVDGETNEHREREIAKISAELKWCWKDLGVAGMECAQLNRAGGQDRPTLASLRDSGSLEQDADVVILLHREDYYRSAQQHDHVIELIVSKNKDGTPGVVPCYYDGARQRITDLAVDPFAGGNQ